MSRDDRRDSSEQDAERPESIYDFDRAPETGQRAASDVERGPAETANSHHPSQRMMTSGSFPLVLGDSLSWNEDYEPDAFDDEEVTDVGPSDEIARAVEESLRDLAGDVYAHPRATGAYAGMHEEGTISERTGELVEAWADATTEIKTLEEQASADEDVDLGDWGEPSDWEEPPPTGILKKIRPRSARKVAPSGIFKKVKRRED